MNFKWPDKRWGFGSLDTEGRRKKNLLFFYGKRKSSRGISNILPFSGGRLFAKDTRKFTAGSEHRYESGIHVKRALWWHFHPWRVLRKWKKRKMSCLLFWFATHTTSVFPQFTLLLCSKITSQTCSQEDNNGYRCWCNVPVSIKLT